MTRIRVKRNHEYAFDLNIFLFKFLSQVGVNLPIGLKVERDNRAAIAEWRPVSAKTLLSDVVIVILYLKSQNISDFPVWQVNSLLHKSLLQMDHPIFRHWSSIEQMASKFDYWPEIPELRIWKHR